MSWLDSIVDNFTKPLPSQTESWQVKAAWVGVLLGALLLAGFVSWIHDKFFSEEVAE